MIKEAIAHYLHMGYDKLVNIKKPAGSNVINWYGEKNLDPYNKELEGPLREATTTFYRKSAEKWFN